MRALNNIYRLGPLSFLFTSPFPIFCLLQLASCESQYGPVTPLTHARSSRWHMPSLKRDSSMAGSLCRCHHQLNAHSPTSTPDKVPTLHLPSIFPPSLARRLSRSSWNPLTKHCKYQLLLSSSSILVYAPAPRLCDALGLWFQEQAADREISLKAICSKATFELLPSFAVMAIRGI